MKERIAKIAVSAAGLLAVATAGAQEKGIKTAPDEAAAARKPEPAGRRYALLIGIDDYTTSSPLRNAGGDAQALAKVLDEQYEFEVRVLRDQQATNTAILDALQSYEKLDPDDDLLVYYSGHGLVDENGRAGYWFPINGERGRLSSYVSHTDVKTALGRSPAKHIVLISDSCFGGQLTRAGGSGLSVSLQLLNEMRAKRSREIISSGGLQEAVADGGYRGHSIFAYHLLKILTTSDSELPAANLHSALYQRLTADEYTPQRPSYGRFDLEDDEDGGFVFERRAKSGIEKPNVQEGVPVGWRLPANYTAAEEAGGTWVYWAQASNDPCRMRLVLPGPFRYQREGEDKEDRVEVPFLIDETEVTVERFRRFVRDQQPSDLTAWGEPRYSDPKQPVVGVSLRTAREFARWADKLIPDEIHWEYAAAWDPAEPDQARQHRFFPWSSERDGFHRGGIARCVFPPRVDDPANAGDVSPWLVRGMGSGVREWCLLPVPDVFDHLSGEEEDARTRRRRFGVIRGATQVWSGRQDLLEVWTGHREEAPVSDYSAPNLGFRCIVYLERWDV